MVHSPTNTVLVSAAVRRFVFFGLATCITLGVLTADAAAQVRRARLSDDLAKRLRDGDTAGSSVILTGTQGQINAVAKRHGLTLRKRLKTGAVLDVPAGALQALAADASVDQLSGNHTLRSQMAVTNVAIGADQAWEGFGAVAGATGRGVGVAIIDSGIAPVPALRRRIVASLDFTDDRGKGIDRHGHGTHVAGIVAAAGRHRVDSDRRGVAPNAHLVSLKVLNDQGEGTAADVIQAIDWAVEHKRQYRLRVINLSLGGTPMQSWRDDPICQAVQRAHDAGLVVVASAGNFGKTADGTPVFGGVTVPGTCPHSITVGALNTKGTAFRSDDVVASYSSKGPTRYDRLIKPDLVAPGNRIRGLHVPGSTLSREHPELVIGRGVHAELELSGTSMAAAVVSGAAALIAGDDLITPKHLRFLLQYTAQHSVGEPLVTGGAGRLNVAAALARHKRQIIPPIAGEDAVVGRLAFAGIAAHGIIWGESYDGIIWGESYDGIIWGESRDGIIWGESRDGIIWGESRDGIIWGESHDGIIWGESHDGIIWGE